MNCIQKHSDIWRDNEDVHKGRVGRKTAIQPETTSRSLLDRGPPFKQTRCWPEQQGPSACILMTHTLTKLLKWLR